MIGPLATLDDIVAYLLQEDFASKYVCGDGTYCTRFAQRVDPELVRNQTRLKGENAPHRRWWVERNHQENRFHLWCSYFDADFTPITREQFVSRLMEIQPYEYVDKVPAVHYTEDAWIKWVPTSETEYTATYVKNTPTSGCLIVGPFNKIVRVV